MLKKLRLRLTLICALSTLAVLCAISAVLLAASERELRNSVSAAFDGNIAAVAYRLQTERSVDWDWLSRMEADERLIIHIEDNGEPLKFPGAWHTQTGRETLVDAVQAYAGAPDPAAGSLSFSSERLVVTGERGETYLAAVVAVPARPKNRDLILIKDIGNVDFRSLRLLCLALTAVGAAALALFSWWFAGRAIRPVEEGARRQTEFVAAASHELRSPLAVIRAGAAALACEAGEKGRPFADAIERECARLTRLISDLLTLAGADAGRLSIRKAPVEPLALLSQAARAFGPLAAEKNVEIRVDPPGRTLPVFAGDEDRLLQMLGILLDNAVGYAPEGGYVALGARTAARAVVLCVADNGPGIPDAQKALVFERFTRADPSRSNKDHYGLGLAIAADIARLHGGNIALRDTPGGGLTAECVLPLAKG